MVEQHIEQWNALKTCVLAIFGRNNLKASDFTDMKAEQTEKGIMFQFCISNDAFGKVQNNEVFKARDTLGPV